MRVALVHDWLTGTRGGEKVLLELVRMFPDAPIFTLFHFPGTVPAEIEAREIGRRPPERRLAGRDYRKLLPLFFLAAETWDLSGFELVISTSHCVAKNAKKDAGSFHLATATRRCAICTTSSTSTSAAGRRWCVLAARLRPRRRSRRWDVLTVPRVDALPRELGERAAADRAALEPRRRRRPAARRHGVLHARDGPRRAAGSSSSRRWRRTSGWTTRSRPRTRRSLPLTIAGFGPEEAGGCDAMAGATVRFRRHSRRRPSSASSTGRAEAVLMPGEEDFGIVPVEAQACGTPVIALGRGGAPETVRDGETGVLIPNPAPDALLAAIDRLRGPPASTRPPLRRERSRFSRGTFRDGVPPRAGRARPPSRPTWSDRALRMRRPVAA